LEKVTKMTKVTKMWGVRRRETGGGRREGAGK
jgi:hypothetical protein